MKYDPKTDKELEMDALLAIGWYDGEIQECEEKKDKKGNPMFALTVKVWDNDGGTSKVFDHISPAWFHHKYKHAVCAVAGTAKYESGEVHAGDMSGAVKVELGIEERRGDFPAKNKVADYKPADGLKDPKAKPQDDDSDLPF